MTLPSIGPRLSGSTCGMGKRSADEHIYGCPKSIAGLAADAGLDTSVCEFCEEPLDDAEPWRRGMDGCGAHERCLKGWL